MLELPYHAQRKPTEPGAIRNFISEDLARMVEATRQAVADTRALVHWLKGQGCPAVGVWGFSLGAWVAGLTACYEKKIDAAVLATPVVRLERVIEELPFCAPVRRSLISGSVDISKLSLLSHRPQLAPPDLLVLESIYDLFVPVDTIEELWRAWGQPEIWRVRHGHISIWLSPPLLGRVADWVACRLSARG